MVMAVANSVIAMTTRGNRAGPPGSELAIVRSEKLATKKLTDKDTAKRQTTQLANIGNPLRTEMPGKARQLPACPATAERLIVQNLDDATHLLLGRQEVFTVLFGPLFVERQAKFIEVLL